MSSRHYSAYPHPSSDRRSHTSGTGTGTGTSTDDSLRRYERRSSPPSSRRRSSPNDHQRNRSPSRGQAASHHPYPRRDSRKRSPHDDASSHHSGFRVGSRLPHSPRTASSRDDYIRRDHGRDRERDRPRGPHRSPRRRSPSPSIARGRGPSPTPQPSDDRYRRRDSWDRRNSSRRRESLSRSPPRRATSPRPPRGPKGNPTREVIMEGLPPDMTQTDIKSELENGLHVQGLVDVRVIRDRRTGTSKQFGFLQFATLSQSTTFIDTNYPSIRLHGQSSESTVVHVDFSKEREENIRENVDWICSNCSFTNYGKRPKCLQCQTPRSADSQIVIETSPSIVSITGDNDASIEPTPFAFLLCRGIDPSVKEEQFAKDVTKLFKSSSQGEATKKSGSKIVSTTDSSHFGAQEGSIHRVFVVRDRRTDDSLGFGFVEFHSVQDAQAAFSKFTVLDKFTIASKPVLVSFIHAGVFKPASLGGGIFSFAAASNPSTKLSYWDDRAYMREFTVSGSPPANVSSAPPQCERESKDEAKGKKRKLEPSVIGSNKKAAPSQLQFWSKQQAELHGTVSTSTEDGRENQAYQKMPLSTLSYADFSQKCCYLCFRQFKSEAEVHKHERLSQLHRDNLSNAQAVAKAEKKLLKKGIEPKMVLNTSNARSAAENTDYRDRAKERREAYGQPEKPRTTVRQWNTALQEQAAGIGKSEAKTAEDKPSKGASLLRRMGWTEGQGLGAQGTGVTNAVPTDLYAQGVGLGASGSRLGDASEEAERRTKQGDRGAGNRFLKKAKENALNRYNEASGDDSK